MFSFNAIGFPSISTIVPEDFAKFIGIYLFWSFAHVAASNYYTHYCANWSIIGLITGGFKSITPQCTYARWLQNSTSNCFGTWWFTTGTWLVNKFNWISGRYVRESVK